MIFHGITVFELHEPSGQPDITVRDDLIVLFCLRSIVCLSNNSSSQLDYDKL